MADLLLSEGFEHFSLSHQQPLQASKGRCIVVSLTQQRSPGSSALIAACTLGPQIHLLDPFSFDVSSVLELNNSSKQVLSHPRFVPDEPHSLFAISEYSGVFRWDLRSPDGPAQTFDCSDIAAHRLSFLSMDLSCNGRLVAVGSSATKKGDAFVTFWDPRVTSSQGNFLGVYSDSHSQDVTSLAFHPSKSAKLLSGSTDGLLCRFDLNASREEDALVVSCNAERSVARVGWGRSGRRLCCLTDMETFHSWNREGELRKEVLTLPDGWLYIVDALPDGRTLLVGNHKGDLGFFRMDEESPCWRLRGGHSDTVRSALMTQDGGLVTGGEDGMLCAWSAKLSVEAGEELPANRKRLAEDFKEGGKMEKAKRRRS